MKELLELLDAKERRILVLMGILLVFALLFQTFFALHQKKTYFRYVDSLPSQERQYEKIQETDKNLKAEWLRWDEARRDIPQIEKTYFYKEADVANEVRVDLRKIFQVSKVRLASDLRFDYSEEKEEKTNRLRVRFTLEGSYSALKKFIFEVEKHPRFLMVEKIDFEDISARGGGIELAIVLAGYYES
jgi:Tfp pilus assembly protein PilO